MPIELKNLSVKQKYKDINPIQLKRLKLLDTKNILCSDLKNLICNFKFCIDFQEISNLRNNINNHLQNVNKVLKIINNFIKHTTKKRFLIINFDIYYSDFFIEVRNNKTNLYYQDFFKKEYSQSESEEDEIPEDYPDSSDEYTQSESEIYENHDLNI